jgi:hypothetical protein
MKRLSFALLGASIAALPAPALCAGVSGFSIVNATGLNMTGLTIRRFGADGWKPLSGPRSPGARASVQFSDPDCAFDIQATLEGAGTVVWKDVNLCEAKTVILNRNASGALWVDYE